MHHRRIEDQPRTVKIYLIIVLGFLLAGCQYHNEEDLYGNVDCNTANISFSTDILPFIQTECAIAGCHVTGTGRVVLTNYAGIKSVVDDGRLPKKVLQEKSMPPTRPLNSCELSKIRAWIDQGALNN